VYVQLVVYTVSLFVVPVALQILKPVPIWVPLVKVNVCATLFLHKVAAFAPAVALLEVGAAVVIVHGNHDPALFALDGQELQLVAPVLDENAPEVVAVFMLELANPVSDGPNPPRHWSHVVCPVADWNCPSKQAGHGDTV